ncbi:hypothetical protein M3Y97_00585900 [Aphelenchoides bicaudatus]|nr:hypothetical protein M3Y97_00585900 [Aphelenchoides bicaudatus]
MTSKYGIVIVLHLSMIIADLCFNTASTVLFSDSTAQLMIYILQDTCIILCIIVMLITFSSTFVFQAGLISVLVKQFAPSLIISFIYLALSITLHVISLKDRWEVKKYVWPTYLTIIYVLQRIVALPYYFLYKRTSFLLSDPKYHSDSDWLREKIRQRL